VILFHSCHAQSGNKLGEWNWLFGNEVDFIGYMYDSPLYGPSSRKLYSACYDKNRDNIWIFGGYGYDKFGNLGLLNGII
jgi:hypothetical protein